MYLSQTATKHCSWWILGLFTISVNAEEPNPALDLSVEDLLNVQVTSVAKKAQSLNDAPAAVFVISNEDIKRSAATSIPDALRLAPGLDIARINANQWAVGSRGFNGRFANKLQVLIDGRSAYSRSFSGVNWENQDVMMEDIDRIEVIRGPGASLWGANAVNGVINIITKNSAQTQGGLLNAGGGSFEQGFGSARYGGKLSENTTARAYVKGFQRGDNRLQNGGNADDSWNKQQGGFRLDSQLNNNDTLTVQGDLYRMGMNQLALFPQLSAPYTQSQSAFNNSYGGNFLTRLQHTFSPTSEYKLQVYFDSYSRQEAFYDDSRSTIDVDFQHRFLLNDSHEIVWGLNYRYGHDHIAGNAAPDGTQIFAINPLSVNDQLFSGFFQDEMTLIENKLKLTIGSKFEHNDYSGFEGQPSARIMWSPHNQHRLWAGVSRAVRTPSRAEKYFDMLTNIMPANTQPFNSPFPIAVYSQGSPNYGAEDVITYEVGYRTTFSKSASLDVTGFYNNYENLRYVQSATAQPVFNGFNTPMTQTLLFNNQLQGRTYGIEIASVWQMLDWWRWDVNYSWLHSDLNNLANAVTAISPQQRVSLRGALSPWKDIDLDFWFRYVDGATSITTANVSNGSGYIKPYVTLDLRCAWRPIKSLELSIAGQNLLQDSHLEYIAENQTMPTAIVRGVYGKISWNY
jgi:iron complex outermembrane recepter protein